MSLTKEDKKQRVIRLLRKIGLLGLAEYIKGALSRARNLGANRRFLREHPEVSLPPITLMHDPYGAGDYAWYWNTGRKTAEGLAELMQSRCPPTAAPLRVLEWGCGLARVLRHLPAFQGALRFELFGTDYNEKMIEWCRENLPEIKFAANGLAPPLAFDSNTFDFVFCLSVFTHLSEEMHHAWLAELLRVTKPGGLILLTLHGNYFRKKLLPDELERYDAGKIVTRGGFIEGGRMYTAFHSERFVRESFLKDVDIVYHDPSGNSPISAPQEVWIVRKPVS